MRDTSPLLSFLFIISASSEGQNRVLVPVGGDALLQCAGSTGAHVSLLEWTRPELSSAGYVFFYRDQHLYQNYLHPRFVGRVELRQDGDGSVVLKNVTEADAGTHQCFISVSGTGHRIRASADFSRTVELLIEDGRTAEWTAGDAFWGLLTLVMGKLFHPYSMQLLYDL
ncbi:uncharacterized protein LOC121201756 isoform X2 [Betta splendens]|uniref:Uncharacterized protein LOC121201756 isoform X2 n=1 Tax=Betta splendens TaxID=158456 RepID=A0A9W2Y775_BETSP|nr:uncharacterized protein LOC121201756 isoform X2 [Betta splendens]